VINEGGQPIRPEFSSDEWTRVVKSAGIARRVVLHGARHESVTALRSAGVPDRIVAAWHGHDEAIMRSVHAHAESDRDPLGRAAELLALIRSETA
jgi:hypothetical protein